MILMRERYANLCRRRDTIYRVPTAVCVLFLLGLLAVFVRPLAAHPSDEFVHVQKLHLLDEQVVLEWELRPGALISQLLVQQIDTSADGNMSQTEIEQWIADQILLIEAAVDERPVGAWQVHSVVAPANPETLFAGKQGIQVVASAAYPPLAAGAHEFRIESFFEGEDWWIVFDEDTLAPPGFDPAEQVQIVQAFHVIWDAVVRFEIGGDRDRDRDGDRDREEIVIESNLTMTAERLGALVSADNRSTQFYVIAIVTALVLGALHALTPGHGKTVVAAYLVGTRGTTKHAFLLGILTTITHTGSVLFVGLLVLLASQFFLPETVFPVLEVASGLLIIVLGVQLLRQRLRGTAVDAPSSFSTQLPAQPHLHDGSAHTHGVSFKSLAALGISGGLVPCPDAIAILLLAVAIQRVPLGLLLIVTFSVGLAAVLIVIGLLMVHSAQWLGRLEAFGRFGRYMPIVSALIVIALGVLLVGRQLFG